MKKMLFAFIALLLTSSSWGMFNYKTTSWGATDVIWIQDDVFPTFSITLYLGDGALGDSASKSGLTQLTFSLLTSGTTQKSQSAISDEMDHMAMSFGAQPGYESSIITMTGLMRQLEPSIDLFCHVLSEANFPKAEVNNEIARTKSQLLNLSATPGAMADRTMSIYNNAGTPFENPIGGRLVSLANIKPLDLTERWDFFKSKVKKRLYLLGPKKLLDYEKYFSSRCNFLGNGDLNRVQQVPASALNTTAGKVVFVKIPNSNQVQIRYAAPLQASSFPGKYDLVTLSSGLLGSGFTSLLMQEVRVKKGYTYGISSIATPRVLNAQSMISTFTKNQTFLETVSTVENTLAEAQKNFQDKDHLQSTKKYLVGKQLFQFDDSQRLLSTFINYDHLGRKYSDIVNFSKSIQGYQAEDIRNTLNQFFPLEDGKYNWVFVGDESLVPKVKSRWKNALILEMKDIL